MKLSSVLNKFRKNGLQFEQVESGSAFYICKHELVENTYVQVLTKSNGTDVSTMAIVQKYDEQSESKTFFSTINGLLESFMLDVNRAEKIAAQSAAPQEVDVNLDLFQVIRVRHSEKYGEAIVCYSGVEIAKYTEDYVFSTYWDILEPQSDIVNGHASDVSDDSYINAVMRSHHAEIVKEIAAEMSAEETPAPNISEENFELSQHDDELHVYYRGVYITTYEVKTEPAASHFINYTIEIYREKIEGIELENYLSRIEHLS